MLRWFRLLSDLVLHTGERRTRDSMTAGQRALWNFNFGRASSVEGCQAC